MPEIVIVAFQNRLNPSITFVLNLMFRRSCEIDPVQRTDLQLGLV